MSQDKTDHVFTFRLIEVDSRLQLELNNTTDQTYRQVEILTVFLKDEDSVGGPSRSHIRFDVIETIRPGEKIIAKHRTWVDGRPIALDQDELRRLEIVPGKDSPYLLDLSWQDPHGKTRYQRIPLGH